MEDFIRGTIVEAVARYRGRTAYRTPLVGFAPASDPGFAGLREVVGTGHLLPQDLGRCPVKRHLFGVLKNSSIRSCVR